MLIRLIVIVIWLVFQHLEDIGKTNWGDVGVTLQVNPACMAKVSIHVDIYTIHHIVIHIF